MSKECRSANQAAALLRISSGVENAPYVVHDAAQPGSDVPLKGTLGSSSGGGGGCGCGSSGQGRSAHPWSRKDSQTTQR